MIKAHAVTIDWPVNTINPCSEIELYQIRYVYVTKFTVLKLRLHGISVTDHTEDGVEPPKWMNEDDVYDPFL